MHGLRMLEKGSHLQVAIIPAKDPHMHTGFDALSRNLKEIEKAMAELDGGIAHREFSPHDPQSIECAIQQLHSTIDKKLSPYNGNDIIEQIARELKECGRQAIIDRASAARLADEDDDQWE